MSETRKLTNYSRSLTGAKTHWENERVSVNAFASKDSTRQVIEELRAGVRFSGLAEWLPALVPTSRNCAMKDCDATRALLRCDSSIASQADSG